MFFKFWDKSHKKEPCEHFVDGRDAWKNEVFGVVTHSSVNIILTCTAILLIIWFVLPLDPSLSFRNTATVVLTIVFYGFAIGLIYLRKRACRSLELKHHLHMLAHYIRDKYTDINLNEEPVNIKDISDNLCEHVQRYFSTLTGDKHIGAAIRIASKNNNKNAFITVGRSCLNLARASNSEPLYEDEGVAKIFKDERARRGILIIRDIEKAATEGFFKKQQNDFNFPQDYKSMMVSPIVGWDGQSKGMIGILYITSGDYNVFHEKYTDSVGFISDSLANIYSELAKNNLSGGSNERYTFKKSRL